MILGVPHEQVEAAWPVVAPFVERYLKKCNEHRWDPPDIKQALLDRDMQLWVVPKDGEVVTVVLTEIVNYPRARECNIFMVCGELQDDWRDSTAHLLEWAAAQGCHFASATARKGFVKAMGWDERQTYIVRAL